jgi:methionine-rich copper-binding protein CopC
MAAVLRIGTTRLPRFVWGVAALLAVGLLQAEPASAHAFLDHAEPRVGSTVTASPAAVQLTFTEPVEAAFSRIEVRNAQEQRIDAGAVERPTPTELRLALPPLPAGMYTVHWSVTSVDTHQTEGSFQFTVAHP